MEHVKVLRWYKPKDKQDMLKWDKLLNRGGNFKVSKTTKVCSNHFAAGYRADHCPLPTLYMKGYDTEQTSKKRKSPIKRKLFDYSSPPPSKKVAI